MSTARWKFAISIQNGASSDIVRLLRESGLGVLEAETFYETLLEGRELGVRIRKDSGIDPWELVRNLKQAGLNVVWKNEPDA